MNNIKNMDTLLEYLQQEQESCFSDTNNLYKAFIDARAFEQSKKESEVAVGIDVDHVEIDANGNKVLCLFRNLKYEKNSSEHRF